MMSDLVERLRSDGENERQRFREARATLGPLLADAADRIAQLEAALRAAYEVYAGSEGCIAETCAEGYQQQIITQMVDCISAALEASDD